MRKTTESTDVGRPGSGLANGAKAVTMTLWSWQNSTSCLLFKYGCTSICKSKSSREKYYSHTWRNMNMYKLIHDVSWLYHHLKFMYTYTSICVQYCTCVRPSSRGECRYAFNTTANFAWLTAALILLQILPDWQLVWSCCKSYPIDSWLDLAANLTWLTAGLILQMLKTAWSCSMLKFDTPTAFTRPLPTNFSTSRHVSRYVTSGRSSSSKPPPSYRKILCLLLKQTIKLYRPMNEWCHVKS